MDLSLSEYKAIVEFSPNMVWRAGTDSLCNYFNETWLKFTGKKLEVEIGNGWLDGVHPDDIDQCMKTYLTSFQKRESFEMEYRLIRHDQKWCWINDRGVPFFDELGIFAGYIGSCMDVTEKVEGKKLTEMAHKDKLTGLFNRNYLDYLLEYEFHKAINENSSPTYMMIDIDKFKFFNDHFGHSFGDKILNAVAHKLATLIHGKNVVGRYGGDEFVIIVPETSFSEIEVLATNILKSVSTVIIDDKNIEVCLSIGIVTQQQETEVCEVIEKADKAMYFAKQNGGNQYSIAT